MWRARLSLGTFDPAGELTSFSARVGVESGAVVTFTGLARGVDGSGGWVESLFLQHHPTLTQKSLDDIAAAAVDRFSVTAVEVVHRAGVIAPGEAIVWVAAAAVHRRAAFEAVDYLMDRLKTDAVFWKREEGPDGSAWVEPTDADHVARAGWE